MIIINMKYGLYQTLANTSERKLGKIQRKKLLDSISEFTSDQYEAVFMLICEHARLNDGYNLDIKNLPYKLKIEKDDVIVNIDNLPRRLQRILFNFSELSV